MEKGGVPGGRVLTASGMTGISEKAQNAAEVGDRSKLAACQSVWSATPISR